MLINGVTSTIFWTYPTNILNSLLLATCNGSIYILLDWDQNHVGPKQICLLCRLPELSIQILQLIRWCPKSSFCSQSPSGGQRYFLLTSLQHGSEGLVIFKDHWLLFNTSRSHWSQCMCCICVLWIGEGLLILCTSEFWGFANSGKKDWRWRNLWSMLSLPIFAVWKSRKEKGLRIFHYFWVCFVMVSCDGKVSFTSSTFKNNVLF